MKCLASLRFSEAVGGDLGFAGRGCRDTPFDIGVTLIPEGSDRYPKNLSRVGAVAGRMLESIDDKAAFKIGDRLTHKTTCTLIVVASVYSAGKQSTCTNNVTKCQKYCGYMVFSSSRTLPGQV